MGHLMQVPVETWRTRLWEEALAEAAGRRDWPLAERLQRCFTETRLAHFQLEPGVKVGQGYWIKVGCKVSTLLIAGVAATDELEAASRGDVGTYLLALAGTVRARCVQ